MNRQNFILLAILIALGVVYYFGIYTRKTGGLNPEETNFAVKDTVHIQDIVLLHKQGDKTNRKLTLSRKNNNWILNDSLRVVPAKISLFLKTLSLLEVREPLLEKAQKNMITQLGKDRVEVEIKMDNGSIKKYYVGSSTPDNKGTFMLLEGAQNMYIVHIPGFNGYLNSRYSTVVGDWQERFLFSVNPDRLILYKVIYKNQEKSFTLNRKKITDAWELMGKEIPKELTKNIFKEFGQVNAESILEKDLPGKRKELSANAPDAEVWLQEINKSPIKINIYVRSDKPDLYYAWLEEANPQLVSLQEYHFGKYLQTRDTWLRKK
jgi:hypothetical protein